MGDERRTRARVGSRPTKVKLLHVFLQAGNPTPLVKFAMNLYRSVSNVRHLAIRLFAAAAIGCAIASAADKQPKSQGVVSETADGKASDAKAVEFFEERVRPVLVARCYKCHSHTSGKSKGGLMLDSRNGWEKGGSSGPAIVPGKPDESLLIEAVRRDGLEMPPKEEASGRR